MYIGELNTMRPLSDEELSSVGGGKCTCQSMSNCTSVQVYDTADGGTLTVLYNCSGVAFQWTYAPPA